MIYSTALPLLTLFGLINLGVEAHTGCGGHEIGRRNPGGRLIERAPTDEESAASSLDVTYECTAYSYAPVLNIKDRYPTIWQAAYILPDDTEAQTLFASINATLNEKFPNIKPKGTSTGDFTGVAYNATDPDCWWTWHQCTTPNQSTGLPPDIISTPEPGTWGLGFDDGPNCSHNALYDFLRDQQQSATMFYIGSNVMDWPLQAMRALTDNHQVCVHTWSHEYMTSFTNEAAFAELYYTQKAIKEILGVTPLCWRPPYGDIDNRIRTIAAGLNMTSILWSDDTEDWRVNAPGSNVTAADVDNNYNAVIGKVSNGTYVNSGPVVLNHELNNYTMTVFMNHYADIKKAFTYVVPIAAAYNTTHPYLESNITFPTFSQYVAGQQNVTTSPSTGTDSSSSTSPSGTSSASSSASSSSSSSDSKSAAGRGVVAGTTGLVLALLGAGLALLV
ncbi:chitin deacetylase 2 [Tremella mesenterica]|uniref:chitin deacetylase n=1 Tax=Tremella mesenterica TaxID=5217 RepID=A0A4Q1BW16_TREME|nr:uncharacterized protein TREMEDRAFT_39832 [Tremella mesenterica DSM 1558]EIW68334.1 hypothetical protein TREMEDRAFT_39832 [Tremella mesenterica DSM 1558]RXK42354.1 chitin deacetylase 2 [Tremella mesenterica]